MDLRVPSGWFFLLLGAILIVMGTLSSSSAPLTTYNVNLYAGMAMAIFGGWMLWLARRMS
jgi:hypothetical protein